MDLHITNIQHFSVGDGRGIRTTVFFKGCNLHCPWCHNPETIPQGPCAAEESGYYSRSIPAEELLCELLEDKDFFDASDGGVTFSGGEVMLQADGARRLAGLLKEHGIRTWIDTAGCVPYCFFEKLNPFIEAYLFDFKTASEEKYRQIGGSLALVTGNLKRLKENSVKVYIRIPLIPAFNTDSLAVERICRCLQELGVNCVALLPFHRLGSAKYDALGLKYEYKDVEPLGTAALEKIRCQYEQYFMVTMEQ